VRSTGSKRLARMFDTLAAETRLCMVALESFYPERADLITEHAEIVEAIRQRDAAAATRLLDRHMADSVRRLARKITPAQEPSRRDGLPGPTPCPGGRAHGWHSSPPSTTSVCPVM